MPLGCRACRFGQRTSRRPNPRREVHLVPQANQLSSVDQQLSTNVDDLQRQHSARAHAAAPIDSALREEYVERAAIASRPLLTRAQVRRIIDRMLADAGWAVQDLAATNVHAAQGVAVREVPTATGRAAYLLYVDAKLVGVIKAKREGVSLGTVDRQSERYASGLDASQRLAAWRVPLPFHYESTAVETRGPAASPGGRDHRVGALPRRGPQGSDRDGEGCRHDRAGADLQNHRQCAGPQLALSLRAAHLATKDR